MRVRTEGIDPEHGGRPLLDLKFADDILVLATSWQQAARLLDELVVALAHVGSMLNEDKTKLLTTQTRPPKTITIPRGISVAVVDREGCHKWLGCILFGKRDLITDRILNIICRLHRGRSLQTETFSSTRPCP